MEQWRQVNVTFPDWGCAEHVAAARIAPHLDASGAVGWWFVRKHPCWRIRYQPGAEGCPHIGQRLDVLAAAGYITGWATVVYEPETCAFGGEEAMGIAHRLFHADSRCILAYLHDLPGGRHRREISLILCSIMMRAARQDLFEQGDVWARVARYRKPPPGIPGMPSPLDSVLRLITADTESQMRDCGPLGQCASWAAAYAAVGKELAALTTAGRLHRGLRDILAHHVIFAWNRLGLSYTTQSVLASTAKTAIFGADPTEAEAR